MIERLSHVANIGYIKDASNNTGRLLSIINQVGGRMKVFAACIKGALELQGYAVGAPLPPQAALTAEAIEDVRRTLVAIGAL